MFADLGGLVWEGLNAMVSKLDFFHGHELTWASKWQRGIIESLKPHPCDTAQVTFLRGIIITA